MTRLYHKHSHTSVVSWDDYLPVPKLSFQVASAVVAVLAIICFANSYDADFVFDDSEAILNNADVSDGNPLSDVFLHDFWGKRVAANTSHKSYRPLTVLTFRFNTYLAGGLFPRGFHIINIITHAIVCILFLSVASFLLSGTTKRQFCAPRASLLAASLFAVHPIHTESVAGIVGRADLMCALCFLLSFLCYIKASFVDEADGLHDRHDMFSLRWMCVSMLLAGISVLFKEQGITVLGICSAYDVLVLSRVDIVKLFGLKWFKQHDDPSLQSCTKVSDRCKRALACRHMILLMTGVLIIVSRWRVMGSEAPTFQIVDNPHSFVNSTILRIINYNYVYALNAFILICPIWLCFDWSMGCVPVINTLTDHRILIGVLPFWTCVLILIVYSLRMKPSQQQRLSWMSIAFVVIPFLPASNLFFRVGFVVAERILYLPVGGIILLLTAGATILSKHRQTRILLKICIPFLLSAFIAKSIQRSSQWQSESSLFESGANVCPLNAKVHYNRAKLSGDSGNTEFAIDKYQLALRLNPTYDQAMNNLANILKDRGEHAEAETLLLQAVNIRPDFAAAWMNLGVVQAAMLKLKAAETSYLTALRHRRHYPDCYHNLGNLYLSMEHHQRALMAWRNATIQKPTHISAWSNMILLLDQQDRLEELHVVVAEATRFNPNEAVLYYNYASALGKADKYEESEANFLRAIRISPHVASYHANLGVLYHRWGKLHKAESSYKLALQLDANSPQTVKNLKMLRRKLYRQHSKTDEI